ncbi:MAG: 4Fe-4S binding protein [Oscillospiraceae bacterium]|jgi:ferredoxin|nr:4Fe-4S binding protein [Oscillospiraceae bacterium]
MYKISSECICCGACVSECPVDAISEGDAQYNIADTCIDCGACVGACPVDAISP